MRLMLLFHLFKTEFNVYYIVVGYVRKQNNNIYIWWDALNNYSIIKMSPLLRRVHDAGILEMYAYFIVPNYE